MRLGIRLCFILLVMFGVAAAKDVKNSSNRHENGSAPDANSVGIHEFSEEADTPPEGSDIGETEDSAGAEIGRAKDETGEYTEEDAGVVQDTEVTIPEEEGFDNTPAHEIHEHFKPDEDESFGSPPEDTVETETKPDQKPEPEKPAEPPEIQDEEKTVIGKKEKDRQDLIKRNDEYEKINQKKEELDLEFKSLEKERKKLVEEKEGLKTKEDILKYNEQAAALNEKLKQYDEKRKSHDEEVQDFNNRVKQDMEKKIQEAESRNIDTNYEAFDEKVDISVEVNPYERLEVDTSAPIEEQRKTVLKYKAQIEKEYQMLMKQREEIDKEKKLVKTIEDVDALNRKTSELNTRIAECGQKRIQFEKDLNEFNSRLEDRFSSEQKEEAAPEEE